MSKYAPDLAKHRFYLWLNNYHWLPTVVLAILLCAIAGFPLVSGASASRSSSAPMPRGC